MCMFAIIVWQRIGIESFFLVQETVWVETIDPDTFDNLLILIW
jgi:hypothetical protein